MRNESLSCRGICNWFEGSEGISSRGKINGERYLVRLEGIIGEIVEALGGRRLFIP